MGINLHQVVAMTYEEQVAAYQKLTKAELIKMLIESNRLLNTYLAASIQYTANPSVRKSCNHQWCPLPSVTTGVSRYQCAKCGTTYESVAGSGDSVFYQTVKNEL